MNAAVVRLHQNMFKLLTLSKRRLQHIIRDIPNIPSLVIDPVSSEKSEQQMLPVMFLCFLSGLEQRQ